MCLSSRTRTMSRRSPRFRSSGSSGLDLTATVSDVSPMPPSPDVSANAPDAQRSSALGFLLRKKPMDGARVSTYGLVDGKGPEPTPPFPRSSSESTASALNSHRPEGQHEITVQSTVAGVRTARVTTGGDPRSERSIPRDIGDARAVDRAGVAAPPASCDARETAPRCGAGLVPLLRDDEKKNRSIHSPARDSCSRGPNFPESAVPSLSVGHLPLRGHNVIFQLVPHARTHARTHSQDGRRHRDPQAGRRRDLPQARAGRHRPLHRCASRRLPRKCQTRARATSAY